MYYSRLRCRHGGPSYCSVSGYSGSTGFCGWCCTIVNRRVFSNVYVLKIFGFAIGTERSVAFDFLAVFCERFNG